MLRRKDPPKLRCAGRTSGWWQAVRYTSARLGRIFVARVDHGEDFLGEMRNLILAEGISHAVMLFLGALQEGSIVTGPESPVIPPSPHFERFRDGWEVVGIASVYPGEDGPAIHVHGSCGRGDRTLTGCLRVKAETYLVMEVVVFELDGLTIQKTHDDRTGVSLPDFGGDTGAAEKTNRSITPPS
jgi:predicted DNA-binding protein with PD1-like motif